MLIFQGVITFLTDSTSEKLIASRIWRDGCFFKYQWFLEGCHVSKIKTSLILKTGTPWSKYVAQSPKGRLVQSLYKPIHGECAIYFYPGVVFPTKVLPSSCLNRHRVPLKGIPGRVGYIPGSKGSMG